MTVLFSCVETVTPPLIEDIEDVLVVNALLNPSDSVYEIEVQWAEPAFGLLPDYQEVHVTTASVAITGGNETATFIYDDLWGNYRLRSEEFAIEAGSTYTLDVSAEGVGVSATVVAPSKLTALERVEIVDENRLRIAWQDFGNEENYYRLFAETFESDPFYYSSNPIFFGQSTSEFYADTGDDGEIITKTSEENELTYYDSLQIYAGSYSPIYVDYFEVLNNYIGDDPFSEPVQLPSNIEGGLGIFSIYQIAEFRMATPD